MCFLILTFQAGRPSLRSLSPGPGAEQPRLCPPPAPPRNGGQRLSETSCPFLQLHLTKPYLSWTLSQAAHVLEAASLLGFPWAQSQRLMETVLNEENTGSCELRFCPFWNSDGRVPFQRGGNEASSTASPWLPLGTQLRT